jgi:hypothetical protein
MPNRLPGPSLALSRCPNSGKTGSPGYSSLSRTTTRSCRDKSGSAASSRSGRCKNLTPVRRQSAQRLHPAPAGRNKSHVALHAACIRGDRGRTGCDRHRGGATTARERLQVGPSRDGMRSYFTITFSQTITTPPFLPAQTPISRHGLRLTVCH